MIIGAFGFYMWSLTSVLLLNGVLIVYFCIMTQLLYPMTLAVYAWCSGNDPSFTLEPTFSHYSVSYCALILFLALSIITMKKDLSVFLKVGSFGVIFVFMLIIFIIMTGIIAMTNTEFMVGSAEDSMDTDWSEGLRTLTLYNSNFSPLAGILGLGYFLHTICIPMSRSAANPEKNERDFFLGYLFVFISYIAMGILGYIGFMGVNFSDYFIKSIGTSFDGQIE